ncbi:MAG: TRAP transporter fused permease subunit [Azospirillum sp.]|nr:TRAP transporter fused permease subunit [Azospirillum sp.]
MERENPASVRAFGGVAGKAVFAVAITFSAFQVWTAAFSPLSSLTVRSVHVGFLLLMAFLLFGWRDDGERASVPWYDALLGVLGFALAFYHWVFEADLIQRSGDPSTVDLVVGALVLVLLFEAARRMMGWILPVICGAFIPYALFGRHLPWGLAHRGFGLDQVIDALYLGTEGIYGTPTFVSSTYIFLFILFGAFLERAGMIKLFTDVSLGLVGHAKGGPAKVAVVSSGFMGTINGSGVANVLTTGQFTIPLMMRFGYRPAFAGAVEATSSMGGQLMPPVMGAAAFIMAETIEVPYSQIALTALIPALLYYASAFWMVHLEAGRRHLTGLPKAECPSALAALRHGWYLILPLAALVTLLFSGYTPLFAGVIGLACTAVLILGERLTGHFTALALRLGFWIVLGLATAAASRLGWHAETVAFAAIALLVVPSVLLKGGRETLRLLVQALADGARNAVGVGIACALVGILIGMMTLTGLASSFAGMVVSLAGGNLFLALLLTMLACIVLGTGVPTTANYIITSSIAAPALLHMGVPLIVSHMFCFYFGIMADLTPPVALAALAASSISKAGYMETGLLASRVAMAGYVIPFMAVYDPALLLQSSDLFDTVYMIAKAILAICLWGGAVVGYFWTPLGWHGRIVATTAAFFLVVAAQWTDGVGFALAALFMVWQGFVVARTRHAAAPPA